MDGDQQLLSEIEHYLILILPKNQRSDEELLEDISKRGLYYHYRQAYGIREPLQLPKWLRFGKRPNRLTTAQRADKVNRDILELVKLFDQRSLTIRQEAFDQARAGNYLPAHNILLDTLGRLEEQDQFIRHFLVDDIERLCNIIQRIENKLIISN